MPWPIKAAFAVPLAGVVFAAWLLLTAPQPQAQTVMVMPAWNPYLDAATACQISVRGVVWTTREPGPWGAVRATAQQARCNAALVGRRMERQGTF